MKKVTINVLYESMFEAYLSISPTKLAEVVKNDVIYHFISATDNIECDVCIVIATGRESFFEKWKFKCAQENVIAINVESLSADPMYSPLYLKQFGMVWGVQGQLSKLHSNTYIHKTPATNFVFREYAGEIQSKKKLRDYDFFKSLNSLTKNKTISVIASNRKQIRGHRDRLKFAMALKNYFGDQLDLYGRGINTIEDKTGALFDYKYHIAIENACYPHYITEKIEDSFLCLAYPFYYGAPNIYEYYPKNSLACIDIYDVEKSIKIIEETINNNAYEKNIANLILAKDLVLEKYNFFYQIIDLCENKLNLQADKKQIVIEPRSIWFQRLTRKTINKIFAYTQEKTNKEIFKQTNIL